MSDKINPNLPEDEERVLDLEAAKEMTVAEAAKTQGEIEAGVKEDDGLLDRYIKQHRDEIEADKFETKKIREEEMDQAAKLADEELSKDSDQTRVMPVVPEDSTMSDTEELDPTTMAPSADSLEDDRFDDFPEDDRYLADERAEKRRKLIGLLLAGLALLGIVFTLYSQREALSGLFGGTDSSSATSSSSSASSSKPSSEEKEESSSLKAFNDLYASFFTDDSQTALNNDSFGQLSELETALSALEGTDDYAEAKEKFDALKAAVEATQALNDQFDKPVLVNGQIDTSATVNSGVALSAPSTGIASIDAALTAAVNFGRSQQESAAGTGGAVAPQGGDTGVAEVAPAPSTSGTSNPVTLTNGITLDYGKRIVYGNDQVSLQRDVTRVPYNDELIADASNEAWIFNPGILEKIIATSNQRGYFSGNEFILEKVNIINGNGYYNMFRTDGVYLFSINAKTGYFFGNASGRKADY